jgi:hypothetical protein
LISLLLSGERASKAEPKPATIARPVCIETRRAPFSDLLITTNPQRIERRQPGFRCAAADDIPKSCFVSLVLLLDLLP